MPWIKQGVTRRTLVCIAGAMFLLLIKSFSAEEKRLTVYLPQTNFQVPVTENAAHEYVRLLDLLEHFGDVNLKAEKFSIKLKLAGVEGQFVDGAQRAHIGRATIQADAPFRIADGNVLAPVSVLDQLLGTYIKKPVELHASGRRMFVDGAAAIFVADLKRSESSTLQLKFPLAVNPTISTEGGRVRLTFSHEPVVFYSNAIAYQDKLISQLTFSEQNGTAQLDITGTAPLMASFSDGGRGIAIAAVPAPQKATATAASPTPPPVTGTAPAAGVTPAPAGPGATPVGTVPAAPTSPAPAANGARFFVMIDAAHGGDEPGAKFTEQTMEKDVVLILAHRLRAELQSHGVNSVMLRSSDQTLSTEQRAVAANTQRADLYITIHATLAGKGVRVYTAMQSSAAPLQSGPFLPWSSAQSPFVGRSRNLAAAVATEIGGKGLSASNLGAAVAPLNNIAAPALALEVGPRGLGGGVDSLEKATYQNLIAQAVATAIANQRAKPGELP
jgi:N-acetylmuramoyl-L-alanine amidase